MYRCCGWREVAARKKSDFYVTVPPLQPKIELARNFPSHEYFLIKDSHFLFKVTLISQFKSNKQD